MRVNYLYRCSSEDVYIRVRDTKSTTNLSVRSTSRSHMRLANIDLNLLLTMISIDDIRFDEIRCQPIVSAVSSLRKYRFSGFFKTVRHVFQQNTKTNCDISNLSNLIPLGAMCVRMDEWMATSPLCRSRKCSTSWLLCSSRCRQELHRLDI